MDKLTLYRIYLPNGTVGALCGEGPNGPVFLCFTIELPWLNNEKGRSCIPEGTYSATYEKHRKHGHVWRLADVPGRSGILVHAANRTSELRGCIAPNLFLENDHEGRVSREAVAALVQKCAPKITITITKSNGGTIQVNTPVQP